MLRTLESLDPEDDTPRYARSVRGAVDDAQENDETKSWLDLADGLDYSAKVLIRHFLTQATQSTINKSADWVSIAKAAGADTGAEGILIPVLLDENSMLKGSDAGEEAKKRIEDRIKRLEAFAKLAMEVVSRIRQSNL